MRGSFQETGVLLEKKDGRWFPVKTEVLSMVASSYLNIKSIEIIGHGLYKIESLSNPLLSSDNKVAESIGVKNIKQSIDIAPMTVAEIEKLKLNLQVGYLIQ